MKQFLIGCCVRKGYYFFHYSRQLQNYKKGLQYHSARNHGQMSDIVGPKKSKLLSKSNPYWTFCQTHLKLYFEPRYHCNRKGVYLQQQFFSFPVKKYANSNFNRLKFVKVKNEVFLPIYPYIILSFFKKAFLKIFSHFSIFHLTYEHGKECTGREYFSQGGAKHFWLC